MRERLALLVLLSACTAPVVGLDPSAPPPETPVPPPPPPEPIDPVEPRCAAKWSNLDDRPDPNALAASFFDPVRRRLMIIAAGSNEVWALPVGEGVFRQLEVEGSKPRPSRGATAIYDPDGDRAIVFGGFADGAANADLWSLSLDEPLRWRRLDQHGELPTVRWLHSAVYDPDKKRMIVYGGDAITPFQVVRVLALETMTWSAVNVPGNGPGHRKTHAAIWDRARSRMIIYGGLIDQSTNAFDAWALELEPTPRWRLLTSGIGGQEHVVSPAAVLDEAGDRMVIFGESDRRAVAIALGSDRLSSLFVENVNRGRPAIGVDAASSRVVAYGGELYGVGRDEAWTWPLEQSDPPPARTVLLPGGKQPAQNGGLWTVHYDRFRESLVMVAPIGRDEQVWTRPVRKNSRWEEIEVRDSPWLWDGAKAALDPAGDRLIFFPSRGASAFDLSGRVWFDLPISGTPQGMRSALGAVFDAKNDRIWVSWVGGFGFVSLDSDPATWNAIEDPGHRGTLHFDELRDRLYLLEEDDVYEYNGRFNPIASGPPWPANTSVSSPERDSIILADIDDRSAGDRLDLLEFSILERSWRRIPAIGNLPALFGAKAVWTKEGVVVAGEEMSTYLVEISSGCDEEEP
jgi:hypothetical protein